MENAISIRRSTTPNVEVLFQADHKLSQDLTQRETEVLTWVALGKSNCDIADILGISIHTVDTYIRRIMQKFDVVSRTTAAVRAAQMGILPVI